MWLDNSLHKREVEIHLCKQTPTPEKFYVVFSGKVLWLEFWSLESLLLAGIQSIFVKFDDNVRIIMNPKSVSRIFDFSLFLEIWRLHWKLSSRVLLSSLKDNNPKITNRKNTNPGHPFQVQNICRSRSDIKETCWLKCVVL